MPRIIALTTLVLASTLADLGAAPAASAPRPSTSVTTSGVTLTMTFARMSYPMNGLAQAVVTLTNHTGRALSTWDCVPSSLGAEVIGREGEAVYPPLLTPPGAPWSDCQGATASPRFVNILDVAPGQTVVRRSYVVLRSLSVRAWADLRFQRAQKKPVTVLTAPLHLHTLSASGPRIRLRTTHGAAAVVTSVPGSGPLLYSQFAYCRDGREHPMVAGAVFSHWTPTSQHVLHPFHNACASLAEWSLFVAQPGRSIAHAYFCASHNFCDYAPPTAQDMAVSACKRDIARAVMTKQLPPDAVRYAIGLTATIPADLSPAQALVATTFHKRCAHALKLPKRTP